MLGHVLVHLETSMWSHRIIKVKSACVYNYFRHTVEEPVGKHLCKYKVQFGLFLLLTSHITLGVFIQVMVLGIVWTLVGIIFVTKTSHVRESSVVSFYNITYLGI